MQKSDTIQIHDLQFVPLITEEAIQDRVRALGQELTDRYRGKNPLFISILSGAFVFASDLIRAFDSHCEIGFVKLASYSGTRSSGDVQTVMGLDLRAQSPASVSVVTFLRKPDAALFPVPVDQVGFDIEDKFVVGYGLDYDGLGRNLSGIWQRS
jgi:hypoxanthine phosphoribosyltransferase